MDSWLKQEKRNYCLSQDYSDYRHEFQIPLDGSKVELSNIPFGEEASTQTYFFILQECQGIYRNSLIKGVRIAYEAEFINSDGSHFSEEENKIMSSLFYILAFLAPFLAFQVVKVSDFYFRKKAIDYPVLMLTLALLVDFLAILGEWLHLYFYAKDGMGLFLLDLANVGLSYFSQFIISTLFIVMAIGWTVKPMQRKDEELFINFGLTTGVLVCMMGITTKVSLKDVESFHDYHNTAGLMFMGLKLIIFYMFIKQVWPNYKRCGDGKMRRHFLKLGIFGTMYLLSLPVMVLVVDSSLPLYLRHKVITFASILIQSMSLLVYVFMVSSKENENYPIYYKNRTFVSASKLI